MKEIIKLVLINSIVILLATITVFTISAYAVEYKTGDKIEVSLTNATSGAVFTGKICNLTISNTSAVYTNISMTDNNDGTYYWTLNASVVPNLDNKYKMGAACAINGNIWYVWDYFYVVSNVSLTKINNLPNATEIYNGTLSQVQSCGSGNSNLTDSDVWNSATRTLTDYNQTDIFTQLSEINTTATAILDRNYTQNLTVADIWEYANRSLTEFPFAVNLTQDAFDIITFGVWSYANRSLTEFGTLVVDIWTYGTRTLSDFGSLITDIWASGTRTLTQNITQNITTETLDLTVINQTVNVTTGDIAVYNQTIYDNSTINVILPAEAIS